MDATLVSERRGLHTQARRKVLDITVLMGGPSMEREVSLVSGRAVAEGLARRGHKVTTADISPRDVSALDRPDIAVVFLALHGEFGEDGQVQRLCEARGLAYTGSGPAASATAMDKIASKEVFRTAGLVTPPWAVLDKSTKPRRQAKLLDDIGLPCVLKPAGGGSSVDITIARDEAARDQAVEQLLARYGLALVESFITGREMTVGVLGEATLPPIEIKPAREFYDYFAKYQDDATQYLVNPAMDAAPEQLMRAWALAAHRALGCRDFSRVDFILTAQGVPHVLEVNTIPGFTSHSLLPKAAAAAGIPFDELCDRMVQMALARAGR